MLLTMEQLRLKGAVCIENIVYGMKYFHNRTEKYSAHEAENIMREMWTNDKTRETYVDFYYFILEEGAKGAVRSVLTEQEACYLETMEKELLSEMDVETMREQKAVIFPLEQELLKIATKLNEKEMLFSTFYFIGEEISTWWGNYNQEYIIFTKSCPE